MAGTIKILITGVEVTAEDTRHRKQKSIDQVECEDSGEICLITYQNV